MKISVEVKCTMRIRSRAIALLRFVLLRCALPLGLFRGTTKSYRKDSKAAIPLVMCLWNRPSRLQTILEQIDAQQDAPPIHLILWNNAKHDRRHYSDVFESFQATGAIGRVTLIHSLVNAGGMGRFFVARKVSARGRQQRPILFLDDDQNVSPDFVRSTLAQFARRTAKGWWAWTIFGNYFDRVPAAPGASVDYAGTGGMVIDGTAFRSLKLFWELPTRYWFIEDLWLCSFVKNRGWELGKLEAEIEFVMDETNQNHVLFSLKPDFYEWLRTHHAQSVG